MATYFTYTAKGQVPEADRSEAGRVLEHLVNDMLNLQVRFLADAFDANYEYNGDNTYTVILTYGFNEGNRKIHLINDNEVFEAFHKWLLQSRFHALCRDFQVQREKHTDRDVVRYEDHQNYDPEID